MECAGIGCSAEAAYKVTLIARNYLGERPEESKPLVYVCEAHSNVDWYDVIKGDTWQKICLEHIKNGKKAPRKKHSELKVSKIIDKVN